MESVRVGIHLVHNSTSGRCNFVRLFSETYTSTSKMNSGCLSALGSQLQLLLILLQELHVAWTFRSTGTHACGFVECNTNDSSFRLPTDGVLVMLARDEIDVSGFLCNRKDTACSGPVQYSAPVEFSDHVIVVRKSPTESSTAMFRAVLPFNYDVWLALMAIFLIFIYMVVAARRSFTLKALGQVAFELISLIICDSPVGSIRLRRGEARLAVQAWVWTARLMIVLYLLRIKMIVLTNYDRETDFSSADDLGTLIAKGEYRLIGFEKELPEFTNQNLLRKFMTGREKYGFDTVSAQDRNLLYDRILDSSQKYVYMGYRLWTSIDLTYYLRAMHLVMVKHKDVSPGLYSYVWRKELNNQLTFKNLHGQLAERGEAMHTHLEKHWQATCDEGCEHRSIDNSFAQEKRTTKLVKDWRAFSGVFGLWALLLGISFVVFVSEIARVSQKRTHNWRTSERIENHANAGHRNGIFVPPTAPFHPARSQFSFGPTLVRSRGTDLSSMYLPGVSNEAMKYSRAVASGQMVDVHAV